MDDQLTDIKNQLPEEISENMSLNRFFAFQRDIVNDELELNVPRLIEDALENPTGSYQLVTKEQNLKLSEIGDNTTEILNRLEKIQTGIDKVSESVNGSGSGGGLLESILKALGLGAGAKGILGRGGKKDGDDKKGKKGRGRKGRGRLGLLTKLPALLGLGYVGNELIGGIEGAREILGTTTTALTGNEKLGESAADIGLDSAVTGGLTSASKIIQKSVTPTPTASPTPSSSQGPSTGRKRLQLRDPKTGRFIKAAKPKPTLMSRVGNLFSGVKSAATSVGKFVTNAAGKLLTPAIVAYTIWQAWGEFTELQKKNLPKEEFRKEVNRIISTLVADVGILAATAGIGALIGTAIGAVGAGVGAVPGFLIGAVGGAVAGVALDYGTRDDIEGLVSQVVEYFYPAENETENSQNRQSSITNNDNVENTVTTSPAQEQTVTQEPTRTPTVSSTSGQTPEVNTSPTPTVTPTGAPEQTVTPAPTQTTTGATTPTQTVTPEQTVAPAPTQTPTVTPEPSQASTITTPIESPMQSSVMPISEMASLGVGGAMLSKVMSSTLPEGMKNPLSGIMSMGQNITSELSGAGDKIGGVKGMLKTLTAAGAGGLAGSVLSSVSGLSTADAASMGLLDPSASPEEQENQLKELQSTATDISSIQPTQSLMNPVNIQQDRSLQERVLSEQSNTSNDSLNMEQLFAQMLEKSGVNSGKTQLAGGTQSVSAIQQFQYPGFPASVSVTALRNQGLADVQSHPMGGPTIDKSRGGETPHI